MPANFDQAFRFLMAHEGGWANDARDPGGLTRFGISSRSYPNVDLAKLTLEGAAAIYRRDYWDRLRCGDMPPPVALLVFDAAVNCGQARSARWLQQAVGAAQDGIIGPDTLRRLAAKLEEGGGAKVCRDLLVSRLFHHLSLGTWQAFGLGWARRLFLLPFEAVTMTEA